MWSRVRAKRNLASSTLGPCIVLDSRTHFPKASRESGSLSVARVGFWESVETSLLESDPIDGISVTPSCRSASRSVGISATHVQSPDLTTIRPRERTLELSLSILESRDRRARSSDVAFVRRECHRAEPHSRLERAKCVDFSNTHTHADRT